MRLKSILKEEKRKEYLWDLIHEEYQLTDHLMIRGTNNEIDKYEEREIRKNRRPRDTDDEIDTIVSGIEDGFYSNIPKRRESKFSATLSERSQVQQYGDFIYYCFAHKDASIVSLPHDGMIYFPYKIGFALDTFLSSVNESNYPHLYNFVEGYFKMEQKGTEGKQLYNVVKSSWDKIKQESVEVFNTFDEHENPKLYNISMDIKDDVNSINEYFENIRNGVVDPSPEILFDGPKYLIVEQFYFNNNFEVTDHGVRIL